MQPTRGTRRASVAATVAVGLLATAASATAATVTVTVNEATAGRTPRQSKHVTLRQGDKLRIAFKGNWYDGGYSWNLTLVPRRSVLRAKGERTIPPPRCCGYPETTYEFYDAAGRGTSRLRYTLTGPAGHPRNVGELTVTVRVQARK